ncbi:MAG TPA: hypothetical protein P5571_00590 [Candidatus Krumholzibacteria bacterium]|nr:hypothetical protein [Candidatus Krumholzibacteria bacterium]HRX49851.1 hypothetical protein [Candidatus Krumholzibacteria bacterium]
MKTKLMTLTLAAALAVGFALVQDAQAYTRFAGSNNCDQCHTGFNGFSGATHQLHTSGGISCSQCHGSTGDNPFVSKCAECHTPNPLWNTHLSAPADGQGMTCGSCHTITANELWKWSQAKRTYR